MVSSLSVVRLPESALSGKLPSRVARLLAEADRRIDAYRWARQKRGRGPDFIPSDYQTVYRWLRAVERRRLAPGPAFCEWGSGFGVVAGLASLVGFQASGIECEEALVEASRQLLEDMELPVQIAWGSFIPDGGDELAEDLDDLSKLDTASPSAYDQLDYDLGDFDLIFAYPWPGQERFLEDLFLDRAADAALLLEYRGLEDVRLLRKRPRRRR